ncbi:sulfatase-like hydrolase/transferase [Shewanella sp. A32]|uniref:sulfatase-like hydrolase/transferase n=1 Tax=Shewanella sp. A32 TaxID=3031327 RepID=UPI0023B9DA2C|nr:sulfatase-like hydrolase/transferase [Shewanella sp. A32]MDF0535659.1 sulfatase-like hydrolase/transferase [Shewanella sp. A32]
MSVAVNQNNHPVSLLRTYLRTLALMLLLLVAFVNYKQVIQFYSAFSLASTMTAINKDELLSRGLILDISYFLGIALVLHAGWAAIITLSCRPWYQHISNEAIKTQIWLLLVLLHFILALAANAYLYPTSLLSIFRNTPLSSLPFITLLTTLLIANFLYGLMSILYRFLYWGWVNSLLVLLLLSGGVLALNSTIRNTSTAQARPNIFIIGIDALRPDHLAFRGADTSLAPYLNSLLSKAVIYDRTYTPLGRTYVAWMSILSGQYPTTMGVRFNLAPPELVQNRFPLVQALSKSGYQTHYAMDERLFNQIDEHYGFDKVVGPKIGAADAIISNMADLPLINLLVNTPIGKYLFPYLYINRAYGKVYDPMVFNEEVLSSLSLTSPNFLAVHFCQLHWPFTSKDFVELDFSRWDGNYNHYMYQQMLKKLDQQLYDFFQGLQQRGLLDNAIVYLLSDHGEGFMLPQDKLEATDNQSKPKLNVIAWGHGTNILDQQQSQVLLAQLRYHNGIVAHSPQLVEGLFSLIDIAPTIFAKLRLPQERKLNFDGQPLPSSPQTYTQNRKIFIESSLPVSAINSSFINEKKVMSETASHYEVRDNGRAVMKSANYKQNIALKQRAVYYRHWQLAMLPQYDDLVLVDTTSQQWQRLTNYHGDAPWRDMLSELCKHFAHDAGINESNDCRSSVSPSTTQAEDPHDKSMKVKNGVINSL